MSAVEDATSEAPRNRPGRRPCLRFTSAGGAVSRRRDQRGPQSRPIRASWSRGVRGPVGDRRRGARAGSRRRARLGAHLAPGTRASDRPGGRGDVCARSRRSRWHDPEVGKPIAESRAEALAPRRPPLLRRGQPPRLRRAPGARTPSESAFTIRVPRVWSRDYAMEFPARDPDLEAGGGPVFGNAVVLKPAEIAPLSAIRLVECLLQGGVPARALGLVFGSGSALGPELVSSGTGRDQFTGSTRSVRGWRSRRPMRGQGGQCEMGGRNAIIVLADADLEAALRRSSVAGFGTTGQRCTSSSRVIIEGPSTTIRRTALAGRDPVRVGPGLTRDRDGTAGLGEAARRRPRRPRAGAQGGGRGPRGGGPTDGEFDHGHFMEPRLRRRRPTRGSWTRDLRPVVTVYPGRL